MRFHLLSLCLILLMTACALGEPPPPPTATFVSFQNVPIDIPDEPLTLTTPDSTIKAEIQTFLDKEARAWRQNDRSGYLAYLLDPQAERLWKQDQLDGFNMQPNPTEIRLERLMISGDWAIAVVVVDYDNRPIIEKLIELPAHPLPDLKPIQGVYELRYLRQFQDDDWRITEPIAAIWGKQQTIEINTIVLNYYDFDEPYLQQATADLASYLTQLTQDLDLNEIRPIEANIVPQNNPLWNEAADLKIRSPVSEAFPDDQYSSISTHLAIDLYEQVTFQLISQATNQNQPIENWPSLAVAIAFWEVDEALNLGYLSPGATVPTSPLPLADIFAANSTIADDFWLQQLIFINFLTEAYGRDKIALLLNGVFTEADWPMLVKNVLDEEPITLEQRWVEWYLSQTQFGTWGGNGG